MKIMIIGQALSQSSVIFAMLISFALILFVDFSAIGLLSGTACLSAGICMGAGAIGPGYGLGVAAQGAVAALSRRPGEFNLILRTMLIGQAVSESTGIYSLVIALILIFTFGR
jgi:ATP synthase F0 subunit c